MMLERCLTSDWVNQSLQYWKQRCPDANSARNAKRGEKYASSANDEKAIVLYSPGSRQPESNGSCSHDDDSKVQLLKVLETRKMVLQKEQGMTFARAVAAGYDIYVMAPLVSFAACFGAVRLMEA